MKEEKQKNEQITDENSPAEQLTEEKQVDAATGREEKPNTGQDNEVENIFDAEAGHFGDSLSEEDVAGFSGEFSFDMLFDLELQVSVELARKEIPIRELLQLGEGAIIEFDKMADENIDILINNKKIAKGEVVVIDDRFGVRITDLLNPTDRLKGITS